MAESHEGENVTLLHMAHREYMTVVTTHAHCGVHIPEYVTNILFFVGDELYKPGASVYAMETASADPDARRWALKPSARGKFVNADKRTRVHVYDRLREMLPTKRQPATDADTQTADMVEHAIFSGADLIAGAPAAIAASFPEGLLSIVTDLNMGIVDAGVVLGYVEDKHDAASAATLAHHLSPLLDEGVRCAVRNGERAAMRMVLGPDGISITHRQLHAVVGLVPQNCFAKVVGWTRPKQCAACGNSFLTLYRCARCLQRVLCGTECQRKDWHSEHKHVCTEIDVRYQVRDFPWCHTMSRTDARFKQRLLGPTYASTKSALFATMDINAGSRIMREPDVPTVWDPSQAVELTCNLARANCRWIVSPLAPGQPPSTPRVTHLCAYRSIAAGERLVSLK